MLVPILKDNCVASAMATAFDNCLFGPKCGDTAHIKSYAINCVISQQVWELVECIRRHGDIRLMPTDGLAIFAQDYIALHKVGSLHPESKSHVFR